MVLTACLILDDIKLSQSFIDWPLHLTLMPWFQISGECLPRFLTNFGLIATDSNPLRIEPVNKSALGPQLLSVTLIKPTTALTNLHQKLLKSINDCGATLIQDAHVGKDFKPHITDQSGQRQLSKTAIVRNMYLVTKESNSSYRQVVHVLNLGYAN